MVSVYWFNYHLINHLWKLFLECKESLCVTSTSTKYNENNMLRLWPRGKSFLLRSDNLLVKQNVTAYVCLVFTKPIYNNMQSSPVLSGSAWIQQYLILEPLVDLKGCLMHVGVSEVSGGRV